jgi:hypothetical protein
MAVDPSIERAEPGSRNARDNRHADPILQAEANAWAWRASSRSGTMARYGRCSRPGRSARPLRPASTGRSGQSPSGSQSVSCSRCRD